LIYIEQFEFLSRPQFSYGQFCSVVGRNKNSTRSWLKDHLKENIGYKNKVTNRMLFSGLDAILTKIFAHLVMNLSTPPGSAKLITLAARNRIKKLMLLDEPGSMKAQKSPTFMVIDSVNEKSGQGHGAVTTRQVMKILEASEVPLIVLPIDRLFWQTRGQVIELAIKEKILPEGTKIG